MLPPKRKTESIVDRWGASLADGAASKCTRRNMLYRVAKLTAGVFGVGFTASMIVDTGMRLQAQTGNAAADPAADTENGCKHTKNGCGADGEFCGLHGQACNLHYGSTGHCPNCKLQSNGCPGSTGTGSFWCACCLCTGSTDNGEVFCYRDCCGVTSLGLACAGCLSADKDCKNDRCPITQDWCPSGSGIYVCTVIIKGDKDDTGQIAPGNVSCKASVYNQKPK